MKLGLANFHKANNGGGGVGGDTEPSRKRQKKD